MPYDYTLNYSLPCALYYKKTILNRILNNLHNAMSSKGNHTFSNFTAIVILLTFSQDLKNRIVVLLFPQLQLNSHATSSRIKCVTRSSSLF